MLDPQNVLQSIYPKKSSLLLLVTFALPTCDEFLSSLYLFLIGHVVTSNDRFIKYILPYSDK